MGPGPSSMRTVTNENVITNGSTNDPQINGSTESQKSQLNPPIIGSTEPDTHKVSTIEKGVGQTILPIHVTHYI